MKFCLRFLMIVFFSGFYVLGQVKTITVDAGSNLGPITLRVGTNCGPYSMDGQTDYSSVYKDLGITAIRTHDYYGPCDWHEIFPDWDADVNQPSSYHFATSDTRIRQIVENGFEVLFRLGTSWKGNRPGYINDPPGTIRDAAGVVIHAADSTDFKKFAEICKHIVMHYNEGWADGYYYSIKRWEIWNEPSLREQFWTGTPPQFFWMFERVAKKLKAHDPTLLVGGPGQAGHTTEAYLDGLIRYCRDHSVPLDFYSYHSYGEMQQDSNPWNIGRKAVESRQLLDSYGFTQTQIYCDEWNAGLNVNYFGHTGRGAAFYAAALTYMAANGIAECYQYRADDHGLGLVEPNGGLKKAAASLQAWKALTQLDHQVECSGGDTTGFTAIATTSQDGETMRLLIANYPQTTQDVMVKIANLPFTRGKRWQVVRKTISDTQWLATIDSIRVVQANPLALQFEMIPGSTQLIELRLDSSDSRPQPTFGDVPYGPHERNVLDFWRANSLAPTPVVVFIHGGGFVSGDKSTVEPKYIERCLENGVSFAAINYRLRTTTRLDTIMRDCGRAIQFLRAQATAWNIDVSKIAAYGGSAGGGASLWLGVHDDLVDPLNADPVLRESSRLAAVGHLNSQATYDCAQWAEIVGVDPGWMEAMGFIDDLEFYHIEDRSHYYDPEIVALRQELDTLPMMDAGDPPMYLHNVAPNTPPVDKNRVIHHPRHAMCVKTKCDSIGIPAVLITAETAPEDSMDLMDFFFSHLKTATGIAASVEHSQDGYRLLGNYPNPFNSCTRIAFYLVQPGRAFLEVFNLRGERVAVLLDGHFNAGGYEIPFEADHLTSGVYFYRLMAGGRVETQALMLLR
ncbi:alpha/beta hydrolase fold domain-containing protein [candidate division KSB1 bacterium]|nr:alpha/beta hydrolase fold domain-containing protein [candidate division KSB1 bacterium]